MQKGKEWRDVLYPWELFCYKCKRTRLGVRRAWFWFQGKGLGKVTAALGVQALKEGIGRDSLFLNQRGPCRAPRLTPVLPSCLTEGFFKLPRCYKNDENNIYCQIQYGFKNKIMNVEIDSNFYQEHFCWEMIIEITQQRIQISAEKFKSSLWRKVKARWSRTFQNTQIFALLLTTQCLFT